MNPRTLIAFAVLAFVAIPSQADQAPPELTDACSYLKDIEAKSQEDCDALKDPAKWAELKAQKPALIESAVKRKGEVQKVYEEFSRDSSMKKLKNDSDRSKSSSAETILLTSPVSEPLNERTFPAWYPNDKDLLDVYKRWIAGVNERLRREKENEESSVSQERRKEIDALLANNKVFLSRLGDDINTSEKFRCFIGDDCRSQGDVKDQMQVFTAESRKGADFQLGQDDRTTVLRKPSPGGSLQKGTPAPEAPEENSGGGWKKWAVIAAATAGGLALGGSTGMNLGKGGLFKKDKWKDAQEEVAEQQEEFEKAAEKEREKAAKEAPPPKAYKFTDGYQPTREDERVINDILENAKYESTDDLMKYITAKTNAGGYGKDPTSSLYEASERVQSMIAQGKLNFR